MAYRHLPAWTIAAPVIAWTVYGAYAVFGATASLQVALTAALFLSVVASVHHAEVIAHRVGEPFGTFLFALAVTVIEAGLIVSVMLGGGEGSGSLVRDTVFGAIMIILNGVVGLCLLVGGIRHGEQGYMQNGVSAALATLAMLSVLTLILPNHVTSTPGPYYSQAQLAFVGIVSLVIYAVFALVQTVRHRAYFLDADAPLRDRPAPSSGAFLASSVLLLASLAAVVWLAKTLGPAVQAFVTEAGAPKAVVGVIIAGLVLLPESVAAVRAAAANRLQTSLNLALGSALATIGLTIPAVVALALWFDWQIVLGVSQANTVLLMLTLIVATLSLSTGRTTILQGALHLVLLAVFLFVLVVP